MAELSSISFLPNPNWQYHARESRANLSLDGPCTPRSWLAPQMQNEAHGKRSRKERGFQLSIHLRMESAQEYAIVFLGSGLKLSGSLFRVLLPHLYEEGNIISVTIVLVVMDDLGDRSRVVGADSEWVCWRRSLHNLDFVFFFDLWLSFWMLDGSHVSEDFFGSCLLRRGSDVEARCQLASLFSVSFGAALERLRWIVDVS